MELVEEMLNQDYLRNGGWRGHGQERQWHEKAWALRDLEERMADFEGTWAFLYEASVGRDEGGVVVVGVVEASACDCTIVDTV